MTSGGAHRRIFCRRIHTVEVRGTAVDQGSGVMEMTRVVSRERARTRGLTAAAGVLMLAVAVVMMVMAAPGHGHVRAHLAKPSAVQLVTDVCHQLTSKGDSPAVRACQAVRPPLGGALLS